MKIYPWGILVWALRKVLDKRVGPPPIADLVAVAPALTMTPRPPYAGRLHKHYDY